MILTWFGWVLHVYSELRCNDRLGKGQNEMTTCIVEMKTAISQIVVIELSLDCMSATSFSQPKIRFCFVVNIFV